MGLNVTGRYRYPDPKPAWLELLEEETLEPALPIVDAHHHLWEEPGNRYLLEDLLVDVACGHNLVATVFVQCHFGYRTSGPEQLRPVGETERIEALRRQGERERPRSRLCAGIVGFADLLAGDGIDEVLDAHFAAAPGHFCGVRQSFARDSHFPDGIVLRPAPAGMSADPRFRQALRRIARRGLCFDAMLYHEQIPELTCLARKVDEATIVLDHFGCPLGVGHYQGREADTFAAWRRDIRALAECPNVHVKLGGLGMVVTGAQWHLKDLPPSSTELAAAWRPWFDVCLEAFGTRRCLFESNFPVDKAMYSYQVLWNAFKRLAECASAAEKADLFKNTAARLYSLTLP
jgi:predicted TIM-barrel fold metal-dependent hydrolase